MNTRIPWITACPGAMHALLGVQKAVNESGLEHSLLELVKMRASQLNGCAHCLDMHAKEARAAGETEQRLHLLCAWREAADLYTERERAALAYAEAVTTLPSQRVADDVYEGAKARFSDAELVNLTLAIVAINGWNRMNVAFQVKVR
jgi:AhpD family alkylhydroperoxidase